MELVTVKIKIENDGLEFDEKVELIISNLRALANHVEEVGGDIQQLKGGDGDSTIEYVHLKETN